MSGGPLAAEVFSLRQELAAVKRLVSGIESRLAALEAEAEFETVSESEVFGSGSGGARLSRTPHPSPPLGSGGVVLSPARQPSRAGRPSSASSSLQGSGGVNQGRSEYSDGTSAANPGPPSSEFRAAIAAEVGSFLARALSGASRGTSGRDRLSLQSKYYIILADYQGRRPTEPLICNTFARVREHCCRGPDRGQSVFVGLPSQVEASVALRTAGFEWINRSPPLLARIFLRIFFTRFRRAAACLGKRQTNALVSSACSGRYLSTSRTSLSAFVPTLLRSWWRRRKLSYALVCVTVS